MVAQYTLFFIKKHQAFCLFSIGYFKPIPLPVLITAYIHNFYFTRIEPADKPIEALLRQEPLRGIFGIRSTLNIPHIVNRFGNSYISEVISVSNENDQGLTERINAHEFQVGR